MKKLIILFLVTSTFYSTSYLIKQIDVKDSSKNAYEDTQIIEGHLSEEKSAIIYKPGLKASTTYPDGFSFNLEEKLNIIHGELYLENKKESLEKRKSDKAAAAALIEEEIKEEIVSNTDSIAVTATEQKPSSSVTAVKEVKKTAVKAPTKASVPASSDTASVTASNESGDNNASVPVAAEPEPKATEEPASAPAPSAEPVKKAEPAPIAEPVEVAKSSNFLSQVEKDILNVTNRYRSENGLKSLVWDETLYHSSRSHSMLMFETNNFVHTTKYAVAENIYMLASSDTNKYSAEFIVAKWMNSPGHRANILDSRITRMGAGVLTGNQYFSKYDRELPTLYATQHFK